MSDDVQYPGVMDNREWSVGDRANQYCAGAETVKIAVGYFYVAGFELLKESFADVDEVKLLIGRQTDEQTRDELVQGFAEDLDRFERTSETEEGVRNLYKLIQDGRVEVKVYTERRFHPKLYLFEYGDGSDLEDRAIVGSSNLSPSGLQSNLELNVEKRENERPSVSYLSDWFDDLWNSESTEEFREEQFREELIEVIEKSDKFGETVQREPKELDKVLSPYEVSQLYIKEFFEREIKEGTLRADIEKNYQDSTEMLAEFQKEAVRAARYTLDSYNGVIIADSVGLGKTYIAASLIQQLTQHDSKVLIAAPNRLIRDDDEDENSTWGNVLNDDSFEIKADIEKISMHKLSTLDRDEVERFRDFDLVVLDEAHRMRNKNKRYAKVQNIGRRDKQFILLTATPIQNSAKDVLNIMKVFANDEDFDVNLSEEDSVTATFNSYVKEKEKNDPNRRKVESLREDIKRVEREVITARTRDYIQDRYGGARIGGNEIKNPERIPNKISYLDDAGSEEVRETYREIIDTVQGSSEEEDSDNEDEGLNLPYIGVQRYGVSTDEEFELRYKNAGGLITVNLLKALESSLRAFKTSIKNLKKKESVVRDIAAGKDIEEEEVEEYFKDRNRLGLLEDIDVVEVKSKVGDLSEEERADIESDAEDDLEDLERLEEKVESLLRGDESDQKIDELKSVLRGKKDSDTEFDEKKLVFTQFRETAKYLFEDITGENADEYNTASFGKLKVGHLSGEVSDDKFSSIVNQFTPKARDADISEDEEIDILISTDVLSVGQNLQDCRVVVNYDLHWNPMVMEQRIGRIDRITTTYDELPIYNFVPMDDLEEVLDLVDTLKSKLDTINDQMPRDSPILSTDELKDAMTVLRKVEEGEGEFEDEIEMKMTRYERFKSRVQNFLKENNLQTEDLRLIDATGGHMCGRETGDGEIVILAEVEYESGKQETVARTIEGVKTDLDLDIEVDQIPSVEVAEDDESEIFSKVESDVESVHEATSDLKQVLEKISNPVVWNEEILELETGVPDDNELQALFEVCRGFKGGEDIEEKAEQIANTLQEEKIADFHANKLSNVYRFRNSRYNGKNSDMIEAAHRELDEFVTVPKKKVQEVDVHLVESLG
jgi:superfamily II DNA or RNA helicase